MKEESRKTENKERMKRNEFRAVCSVLLDYQSLTLILLNLFVFTKNLAVFGNYDPYKLSEDLSYNRSEWKNKIQVSDPNIVVTRLSW